MLPPLRHGGKELASVSLRVPLAGVFIGPAFHRFRIRVIEDALHHARVQQQAFDLVTVPDAAFVCRLTVDVKLIAANRDYGL